MPRHGRRAAKALNTGRQSHAGIAIFIGKPVVLSTCGVETSSSYYHYIGVLHPKYHTYQNINTSSLGLVRADLFSIWARHPKHQTRSSDLTEQPPTTLLEPPLHCILTLPRLLSISEMFSLSLQLWLARTPWNRLLYIRICIYIYTCIYIYVYMDVLHVYIGPQAGAGTQGGVQVGCGCVYSATTLAQAATRAYRSQTLWREIVVHRKARLVFS